jgi:hypothetical protein
MAPEYAPRGGNMKRVPLLVAALGAALAMAWSPTFADQPQTDPNAVVTDKPDPTLTPRDMNEKEQEYLAALKKCEGMAEQERRKCVAAVKTKHGMM